MPRGRKKAEAETVAMAPKPQGTRSSSRVKKSEIFSTEEVSKPSKSRNSNKTETQSKPESTKVNSKKNDATKISVPSKKSKKSSEPEKESPKTVGKNKPKSKAGNKPKPQSEPSEVLTPTLDQSLVRKSVRDKKKTEKFSEWEEQGNKSRQKRGETEDTSKSSNLTKGKKKTSQIQSKLEADEMKGVDDEGEIKSKGRKKVPLKVSNSKTPTIQIDDKVTEEPGKVSTSKSPVKKIQKKRKLSPENLESEIEDSKKKAKLSPEKKRNSPKKRFRSIASTLSKDGKIQQKNAPRKTLGNKDILGLLDEDPEEDIENDLEPEPEKTLNISSSFKQKVPVWRQLETTKAAPAEGEDVFDPKNYGEEEFGPEDNSICPVVKKKTKRKKKDTKAILVFGNNQGVKRVVKEAHNLKTPGAVKKPRKVANLKPKAALDMFPSEIPSSPNPRITVTTFSSDISTGAQNYFDSDLHIENPGDQIHQISNTVQNLEVPQKNFTPRMTKISSRLNSGSCSTPNISSSKEKPVPTNVKEQMKNAFGFDSEDELSEAENTSLSISPVKKVKNPVLEMFEGDSILEGRGAARLSCIPGVTAGVPSTMRTSAQLSRPPVEIVSRIERGPFRVNLPSKTKIVERDLLAQVKALREKEEMDRKKKSRSTRSSPRKKYVQKDPIASSTLLEDPPVPKQKNIKEMFEAVKSKQEQEMAEEEGEVSEASSLYDDLPPGDETEPHDEEAEEKKDKENVETNSPSPLKPVVSKVYKRKKDHSSTSTFIKSPDQSSKLGSPKKETKKVKAFNQWAKHQTSHFSEVEDFDLSFT